MAQCANCNSVVSVDDRFCPSCGKEIVEGASVVNNEKVMGIITDVKRKESMLKHQGMYLIPTNKRLIFFVTNRAIEKEIMDVFAKSLEGQGFKERLKANLSASNRMIGYFQDKSINEILAINPESFVVDYEDVVQLKFPKMITIGSKKNMYRLKIETTSETHEIFFDPQRNFIPEAKELFKSVIPEKVS